MLKRTLDVVGAGLGLLILSPLLLGVAAAIRVTLGSPVLFTQERPGRHAKIFRMRKFRTMSDARDRHGELLPDIDRLTSLGRWLRRTSLDELPELINVVRGEMSLVGPRPLLAQYLPYYTPRERRRHDVRPGITGWAQINGRNCLSWDERLRHDVWYVKNRSLALDLWILGRTVVSLVKRDGVLVDPRSHMSDLDEQRSERRQRIAG